MASGPSTSTSRYQCSFDDQVEEYNYFDMDDGEQEEPEKPKKPAKPTKPTKPTKPKKTNEIKVERVYVENTLARIWNTANQPTSVFDQAAIEQERCPSDEWLALGRIFGAPSNRIEPCRSCCGMQFEKDYTNNNVSKKKQLRKLEYKKPRGFIGWTREDYENSTDSCSFHYVNFVMEKRAKGLQKLQNEKEKQRKQIEKLQRAAAKRKGKRGQKKPQNWEDDYDYMDDDEEYQDPDAKSSYSPPAKRQKKRTVWMCPYCNRSSKFGSVGCNQCGEWFHLSCVGYRSAKEVPKVWACGLCETSYR